MAPSAPVLKHHATVTAPVAGSASSVDTYWYACGLGADFLLLGGVNDATSQSCKYAIVSGTDLSVLGSGDLAVADGLDGYVHWGPLANGESGNSNPISNLVSLDDLHAIVAVMKFDGDHLTPTAHLLFRSGNSISISSSIELATEPEVGNGNYMKIAKTSIGSDNIRMTAGWMDDDTHIATAVLNFNKSGSTLTQIGSNNSTEVTSDDQSAEIPHFMDQMTGLPDGTSWIISTYTAYLFDNSGGNTANHSAPSHSGTSTSDLVGLSNGRVFVRGKHSFRRAYTDLSTYDELVPDTPDEDSISSDQRVSSVWDGTNVFEANNASGTMTARETSVGGSGAPAPGSPTTTSVDGSGQVTTLAASVAGDAVVVALRPSGSSLELFLYTVGAPAPDNIDTGPLRNSRLRFAG